MKPILTLAALLALACENPMDHFTEPKEEADTIPVPPESIPSGIIECWIPTDPDEPPAEPGPGEFILPVDGKERLCRELPLP